MTLVFHGNNCTIKLLLPTGHANGPEDMLKRLETMVLMGVDMPVSAIRGQIASAIDIIIHLGRVRDGSRKLLEIDEILGMEDGQVIMKKLFVYNQEKGLLPAGALKNTKKLKEYGQYEAYETLFSEYPERGGQEAGHKKHF